MNLFEEPIVQEKAEPKRIIEEEVPEYLYHYTDIDSLALILKNHTIRLNSLDKMDDRQEQISKDKQNFGKFVFVSAWTDSEKEDIPMWKMYTSKGRGVRIKLKSNPFKSYDVDAEKFAKILGFSEVKNEGSPNFKFIIPSEEYLNDTFILANYTENNQLIKVKYTDENELLEPQLIIPTEEGINIMVGKLGQYKNKYWEFQKEWRYRLIITPIPLKSTIRDGLNNDYKNPHHFVEMVKAGTASLPFSHYDLVIRDECYNDMSIMLAPDISESAKTFVQLLIEKYNPTCEILQSELTNLIQ